MSGLSEKFGDLLLTSMELLSALFVFVIGGLVLLAIVLYILDVTQTRQAIRRNYPFLGRFRYLFENLGEFFRQYFFTLGCIQAMQCNRNTCPTGITTHDPKLQRGLYSPDCWSCLC